MTEVKEKVGTMVQDIGIEDFLWLIQNANYIVTNSYHGILFSLIFKKDFFWAYQKGCHMSNPRFDMLQQQYEINRRLCVDENYENVKPLDYDIIHDTMMQLREQSSSHLIDSLKKF